jgi:membrane-associated phospholipid phosphatase
VFHYADSLAFTVRRFREDNATSTWSGLLKYEYSVAAYPLFQNRSYWVFDRRNVGLAATVSTPWVPDATRYVVFVRGYNRAGLASACAVVTAASLTAASRVYDHKHWASDVLLGAGIGTVGGLMTVRWHDRHP